MAANEVDCRNCVRKLCVGIPPILRPRVGDDLNVVRYRRGENEVTRLQKRGEGGKS